MEWVLVVAAIVLGAALFAVLTDGRYFGKPLVRWLYDRIGPAVFGRTSEAGRWAELAERVGLRGDEAVLDVGTAVGDLPLSIAGLEGFAGRVVGADWSPRMMAAANAEAADRGLAHRATFEAHDARQPLPFADGEFDVVFCLGLLETLPRPEELMRELVRVRRPGGALVVSLYQGWSARTVALSLDWYREQLASLGIEQLQVAPCRHHHDVVIAR